MSTEEQKQDEAEEMSGTETTMLSTDADNTNFNRFQQSVGTTHSRRLSEEWLPPVPIATSTPLVATQNILRSQQDDENELFANIEQLIRDFAQQPNRRYPLTRVIQWTVGDQPPRMEHVAVVVINRPAIVL